MITFKLRSIENFTVLIYIHFAFEKELLDVFKF